MPDFCSFASGLESKQLIKSISYTRVIHILRESFPLPWPVCPPGRRRFFLDMSKSLIRGLYKSVCALDSINLLLQKHAASFNRRTNKPQQQQTDCKMLVLVFRNKKNPQIPVSALASFQGEISLPHPAPLLTPLLQADIRIKSFSQCWIVLTMTPGIWIGKKKVYKFNRSPCFSLTPSLIIKAVRLGTRLQVWASARSCYLPDLQLLFSWAKAKGVYFYKLAQPNISQLHV